MVDNNNHSLPNYFADIVGNDVIKFKYANEAKTFYLQSKYGKNRYLKIQSVGVTESLEIQANKLLWLKDVLPVPEVLDYGIKEEYEYMITAEIPGIEASNELFKNDFHEVICLIAHGLQKIHKVSIKGCPFDNTLDKQLLIAQENFAKKRIDQEEIERKFGENDLEKLMKEFESTAMELEEDIVFIHGDYSLPNIIINDKGISGFIDLGYCGISDRYYDLAIAEKSILMNFGVEAVDLFYREYGVNNVNRQKVRFYQILENFVHA